MLKVHVGRNMLGDAYYVLSLIPLRRRKLTRDGYFEFINSYNEMLRIHPENWPFKEMKPGTQKTLKFNIGINKKLESTIKEKDRTIREMKRNFKDFLNSIIV